MDRSMLGWMCLAGVVAGVLPGCAANDSPAGTPVERLWESPKPVASPQPAGPAAPVAPALSGNQPAASQPETNRLEIIAVINGIPITRANMADELIRSHGLGLLEQMIVLVAARQRAGEMGLKVTQADIAAAYEDALRRMAAPLGSSEELPLDRQAAEKLLQEFLLIKNISRSQWDRRMEQQAWLHKIAVAEAARMPVSESMLREQYALEYAERVQIRHIQVSSLAAVQRVREALGMAASQAQTDAHHSAGQDFELVARKMSENQITAARGGLMPPFTRNDPGVPPLLREAAFSMEVGQISPALNESNWYHIIRLERRFPASEVGFQNVDQSVLKAHLLERLTAQRQQALEAELFRAATVDVRDIDLRQQFRSKHRETR